MPLISGECVESSVNMGVKSITFSSISPMILSLRFNRSHILSFRILFKMDVEALFLPFHKLVHGNSHF